MIEDFPITLRTPPAQATYERARDARWAEMGERHGYSGLAYGVSAVLAERGISIEPLALTSLFHNQLVGMADAADRTTVGQIARNFDGQSRPSAHLPYDVGNVGRFGYMDYGSGMVDVGWIANEITKKLRADKIRRGTKRYREFVAENAERVVSVVEAAAREKAERRAKAAERWAVDHEGAVEKIEGSIGSLAQLESIALALWAAAELPGVLRGPAPHGEE